MTDWTITITSPNAATGETKAGTDDLDTAIEKLIGAMIEADSHEPGGSGETQERKVAGMKA